MKKQTNNENGFGIVVIVVVICLVAVLGLGVWLVTKRQPLPKTQAAQAPVAKIIPVSTSSQTSVPLGTGAQDDNFGRTLVAKITNADWNPTTNGDAPAAGMHYIAVNLSVTYKGKAALTSLDTIPATTLSFHYVASDGTKLNSTDISSGGIPGKNVTIPGKTAFPFIQKLNPGETIAGYVLYEIPQGDAGNKLAWDFNNLEPDAYLLLK